MAVRARDRTESRLAVVTKCSELCGYTLKFINREGIFPKRSRWMMAEKIADLVNNFYDAVNIANETNVTTASEAEFRMLHITEAIAYLNALDSKMNFAVDVFDINPDLLDFWASLMNQEKKLLSGWKSSEKRKYSHLLSIDAEDATPKGVVQEGTVKEE